MEKSVKHLFKATMKKLSQEWVKYQKRRIYKQMVSGVKLNKLSKEEKEEIRSYYEKHLECCKSTLASVLLFDKWMFHSEIRAVRFILCRYFAFDE